MMRIFSVAAIAVFSSLGVLYGPPIAEADPGGSPVCDPNPPAPGIDPVVQPCPREGRGLDGSRVALPGLPWCGWDYELFQDAASVSGYSWFCPFTDPWPSRNLGPLPYCSVPYVQVPDAFALGGQRWKCPVGSGPAPPPPRPPEVGSGPAPPPPSPEVGSGPAPPPPPPPPPGNFWPFPTPPGS